MAYQGSSSASYSGGSGQMAVISELLHRQCNAAIPHIDVGMDVFAFRDDREEVARIQVKTARGIRYKDASGYSARFSVPMKQLKHTDDPPLFYAMASRLDDRWGSFIVIGRSKLFELWAEGCGSENQSSGNLELRIQFRSTGSEQEMSAHCGETDLTAFVNAWEILPAVRPPRPIEEPRGEAEFPLAHA